MQIIKLNQQNIEDQHICCAFSDKKSKAGYQLKKEWLKTEFKNGYTFRKLDERGKVFIEYVPIEHSWLPIQGQNFMVINCFWVSGKFKGQGYGKELLLQCLEDAKDMDGVIAVSSDKKRPFMSDPKFLKYQGFEIIDDAPPIFKLWGIKNNPQAEWPQFLDSARKGTSPDREGITVYYSNTCPFTEYYNKEVLQRYADEKDIPLVLHHLPDKATAKNMPIPWIINSVFYKGEFVTVEIKPQRHLDKLIQLEAGA